MSNTSAKYEALDDDPQTRGAIALNRLEQAYRAARENVVATTGSARTSGGHLRLRLWYRTRAWGVVRRRTR